MKFKIEQMGMNTDLHANCYRDIVLRHVASGQRNQIVL